MATSNPGDVIDYSQFVHRLNARRDRWSLLRAVMAEWGVVVDPEYRVEITEDAVAGAEERLGFSLPVALKEWYSLPERFHTTCPVYGSYLIDPSIDEYASRIRVGGGFVSFHHEMQSCCEWGFRLEDASQVDPPIYNGMKLDFSQPAPPSGEYVWVPQCNTLSEWVLQMTISDALGYGNSHVASVWDWVGAPKLHIDQLLRDFRPLGFPVQPWFQFASFGGPNAIAIVFPANRDPAWAQVDSAIQRTTVVPREAWEDYWKPTNEGPYGLTVYCRDSATLKNLISRVDLDWRLRESSDD